MDSSEYRILGPLGSGGTGDVFEAARADGTKVALKRFTDRAYAPELLDRFLEEARAQMSIMHPGIVRVLGCGVAEGAPFLVLELVEGMDLAEIEEVVGRRGETIPIEVIIEIIARAADALDYAHHALDKSGEPLGIIHGDISPENILISWTGEVKLTDFGVALDGKKRAYLAPECAGIAGAPASKAADVFALGATLRRLLADQISEPVIALLDRMTAERAEHRPSAGACAFELQSDDRLLVAYMESLRATRMNAPRPDRKVELFSVPKLVTGSFALEKNELKQRTKVQVVPPAPSLPGTSLIGTILHGFRIEELIADRAAASVFRARHLVFDRDYAVKILHEELLQYAEPVDRFQREALLLAKLEHPHVVRALDFGITPAGAPFVAMELVAGITLDELVKNNGPLAHERARAIARQIALALDAAHRIGLVHRDVKPSNVMVLEHSAGDLVKLIDFGVALAAEDMRDRLTATGQLIGTPAFMAPEQIVGARNVSASADLYALGCLIHYLLTGAPPFGSDALEAMDGHLYRDPPLLPPQRGLETIVRALLAKRVEDRPPSAAAVIRELDELDVRQNPNVRAGVGLMIFLSTAATIGYLAKGSGAPSSPPAQTRVVPIAVPRQAIEPATKTAETTPPPEKALPVVRRLVPKTKVVKEEQPEPPEIRKLSPVTASVVEIADLKRSIAALPPKIAKLDAPAQAAYDRRYLDLRSAIKPSMSDDDRLALLEAIRTLEREIDAVARSPQSR